jgi:phenylalanyl-tRNA synthetase alpha chain
MSLKETLEQLKKDALAKIESTTNLENLNEIRIQVLGKKGSMTEVLRGMKDLSPEMRPVVGGLANEIRDLLTGELEEKKEVLEQAALNAALEKETIDVTLPGDELNIGVPHILTQVMEEIEDVFLGLGYEIIEGYEVEQDHYNFERMNIPKDHPARDMQDSFYINDEVLLRTHTSPIQARTMEKHDFSKGSLRMISPGKVFRRDSDDATHSHQFHQIEGLVVAEDITMGDLKGTCFKCGGEGCNVCKQTGWIEILGAGVIHPSVLEMSGIDSTKYSGFAFGLGPDRVAMLKYGVNDIRYFYQNDLRFLEQFRVKG